MPRKAKKQKTPKVNLAELQPDELNELKNIVKEFVTRSENIENEIKALQEDRAALIEEYTDTIDMKTLKAVLKVLKIESCVSYKANYDAYYDVLKSDEVNGLVDGEE